MLCTMERTIVKYSQFGIPCSLVYGRQKETQALTEHTSQPTVTLLVSDAPKATIPCQTHLKTNTSFPSAMAAQV